MSTDTQNDEDWRVLRDQDLKKERRLRISPYDQLTVRTADVESYVARGWEIVQPRVRATRIRRAKAASRLFEDRIWLLFRSLGYGEMNEGYDFRIPIGADAPQIDVFARSPEHQAVIECKSSEDGASSSSLLSDLRALVGLTPGLTRATSLHYKDQDPVSQSVIVCSNNISWVNNHRTLLRENNISILTDIDVNYFEVVSKDSPRLALNQLFAALLHNERIPGERLKVRAMRGREGRKYYYQFVARPDDLVKIAYVHQRGFSAAQGTSYQRLIKRSKLRSIGKYLSNGGKFPTPVVINFHTRPHSGLQFDPGPLENQPDENVVFGTLRLPSRRRSAWVIDGQHRLFGYFDPQVSETIRHNGELFVIAYENLSTDDQARRFLDINTNQTNIPSNLIEQLYGELFWESVSPSDNLRAIRSVVAMRLATEAGSPLSGLVGLDAMIGQRAPITYKGLTDALRSGNLFGRVARGRGVEPGLLSQSSKEETVSRAVDVLGHLMADAARKTQKHWLQGNQINRPGTPGGYLCSNRGIAAFLLVLQDVIEWRKREDEFDFSMAPAESICTKTAPYLQPVYDYLSQANSDDIARLVQFRGSTAGRDGGRELEILISDRYESFKPVGLDEHQRRVTNEIQRQINGGQHGFIRVVQGMFFAVAAIEYPDFWTWYNRVGTERRGRISQRQGRSPTPQAPIRNFFEPEDYQAIANQLGGKVKGHLDIYPGDNLAWMTHLIAAIRNPAAHASNRTQGEDELRTLKEYYRLLRAKVDQSDILVREELDFELEVPELS